MITHPPERSASVIYDEARDQNLLGYWLITYLTSGRRVPCRIPPRREQGKTAPESAG